jgi:hypothetical protein
VLGSPQKRTLGANVKRSLGPETGLKTLSLKRPTVGARSEERTVMEELGAEVSAVGCKERSVQAWENVGLVDLSW